MSDVISLSDASSLDEQEWNELLFDDELNNYDGWDEADGGNGCRDWH